MTSKTMTRLALLALVLVGAPLTWSAELEGISMPDSLELGGKNLTLNGLGLREATMLKVDVYVAGLYVESKSSDPAQLLSGDPAWSIQMKFMRKVGKKSITDAWNSGFKKNVDGHKAMKPKVQELNGYMVDVEKGDTLAFSNVPGEGLTVTVNGSDAGTIPGADFARGMLSVFIGPKPPNAGLKEGLLGQ